VAEAIFHDMLSEAGVDVVYSAQVVAVHMSTAGAEAEAQAQATPAAGARTIVSVDTADGRTFSAKVFIDASYEGDLLARSGVSYIVGREARDAYVYMIHKPAVKPIAMPRGQFS